MFAGGPVRRAGHVRFLRNVLVAAGNSGDVMLMPAVEHYLHHANPLVRGMAVWAAHQLLDINSLNALTLHYAGSEADPDVRVEWKYHTRSNTPGTIHPE